MEELTWKTERISQDGKRRARRGWCDTGQEEGVPEWKPWSTVVNCVEDGEDVKYRRWVRGWKQWRRHAARSEIKETRGKAAEQF